LIWRKIPLTQILRVVIGLGRPRAAITAVRNPIWRSEMPLIRALFAGLVAVILLGSVPVAAAEWKEFKADEFAAAQEDGKPILVDVFAAWCSVCRAQNPILTRLTREPKYKDLVVFKVDFDAQKDVARSFNVQRQSTLIVFKGDEELDRSVGDTSQLSIEGLLDKTL
jgi:thioredoxin 1